MVASETCEGFFSALRQEIRLKAQIDSSDSGRLLSGVSSLRGIEFEQIGADSFEGGTLVSLGSGADVFRPLFDFPAVKNFHLVDSLLGWGSGPMDVIQEIEERLRSLAGVRGVKRVSEGFLEQVNETELESPALFGEALKGRAYSAGRPLEWEVEWVDDSGGLQQKRFFLHVADYNDEQMLRDLLASLGSPSIDAVLITGAPLPRLASFELLLERMEPGALFIWEAYRIRHKLSEPLLSEDRERVRVLLANEEVEAAHLESFQPVLRLRWQGLDVDAARRFSSGGRLMPNPYIYIFEKASLGSEAPPNEADAGRLESGPFGH